MFHVCVTAVSLGRVADERIGRRTMRCCDAVRCLDRIEREEEQNGQRRAQFNCGMVSRRRRLCVCGVEEAITREHIVSRRCECVCVGAESVRECL